VTLQQSSFDFGNKPKRRNLVIEAGAGTGKTTAIVAEVLKIMLEDEELSPERIVLVTFTEKAAGGSLPRIFATPADIVSRAVTAERAWAAGFAQPLCCLFP